MTIYLPGTARTESARANEEAIQYGEYRTSKGRGMCAIDRYQGFACKGWVFYPYCEWACGDPRIAQKRQGLMIRHERSGKGMGLLESQFVVFYAPQENDERNDLLDKLTNQLMKTNGFSKKQMTGAARRNLWQAIDAARARYTDFDWRFMHHLPDMPAVPDFQGKSLEGLTIYSGEENPENEELLTSEKVGEIQFDPGEKRGEF